LSSAGQPVPVIRPILEVSGMRELLKSRRVPIVAVTPIVAARPSRVGGQDDERARPRAERARRGERVPAPDRRLRHRPQDFALADSVRSLGIEVAVAQTVMRSPDERVALAPLRARVRRLIREKKTAEVE